MLVSTDGKPWSESGFQSAWGKATARAGIEGLTFHDLRGTAVVWLARAGGNVVEIYSITGHKPGDVQAILTAHYLPQDGEVARNAIAKLNTYRRGRGDQKETEISRPRARPRSKSLVQKGRKRKEINGWGGRIRTSVWRNQNPPYSIDPREPH